MIRPIMNPLLYLIIGITFFSSFYTQAGYSAKKLYEKSLHTYDSTLKGYYRSKLAKQYPDTAYGLFAQGWLADDEADIVRLYQQSIKAGNVAVAYSNLANRYESDKQQELELRRLAMVHAIQNQDPFEDEAVYFYFDALHSRLEAIEEKQQLYKRLKQSDLISEQLAGIQIRAKELDKKGKLKEALKIIKDETLFNINENLIKLELSLINRLGQINRLSASRVIDDMSERRRLLIQSLNHDDPLLEAYYMGVYEYAKELTKDETFLMKLVRLAFDVRRSPDLIGELYNKMANLGKLNGFKTILDKLLEKYPDYALLHSYLAMYYQYNEQNPQAMFAANKKSIQYAYNKSRKADYINYSVNDAIRFGMVEQAEHLMITEAEGLQDYSVYEVQLKLALLQQQFDKSRLILSEATSKGIIMDKYYFWITELGESNLQNLQESRLKNPFINDWDKKFGGSLSLAIEFPVNSAVIPSDAFDGLDKAGRALKSDGADQYIFRIEGHTDPSGGNKINIPLSQKRAESVSSYLIRRHGIDSGRIQAVGMGDTQPVATNLTEDGRKLNRRVDIRPYGNISEPNLATSGYLDTDSTVFSDDGRFAATGITPISLWDMRYGVRLRELYIGGGERQFSPNNRYLATVSNVTDMRGVVANAIYITDVKTGYFSAIIPLGKGVKDKGSDLDWSPDSGRLAYTTIDGGLFVYDLRKQSVVSATPMSKVRIAAKMAWSKDGRYIITGQSQSKVINVFNAETLRKIRTIDGVDWPHAMGFSDDGNVLLVSNNNGTLSLIDTVNWSLIDNLPLETPIPENIYAIPGTTKVVMDDKFKDKGIAIFDYKNRNWEATISTKEKSRIGSTPDGNGVWIASGSSIELVERNTFKTIRSLKSAADKGRGGLSWDKQGDLLFVQDTEGVNIWHVSQARLLQRLQEQTIKWKADSKEKGLWWTFTNSGELLSFSSVDFAVKRYSGINFKPEFFELQDNWLTVVEDVSEQGASSAKVAIFDLGQPKKQAEFSVDLITASLRYGNRVYTSGIQALTIDAKMGQLALSTWWNDRFEVTYSKNIQRFNLRDGTSAGDNTAISWPIYGLSDMEGNDIRVRMKDDLFTLNLKSGDYKDLISADWKSIELDNGNILKYGSFLLEYDGNSRVVKDVIVDAQVDSNRNVIITQSKSNALTYYSLDTLQPHFFVYFKTNGEWLAADTQGNFSSSLNGTENTYWSFGDNYLPFEALREKYENPRGVKESLLALFDGKAPIYKPLNIDPDILDVPFDVALTSDAQLTTLEENYKLTLKITKQDKKASDPTVYYLVNGRKSRGFDSDPFADMDETLTFIRTIPLGIGENIVEAIVQYKGVDVLKKLVTINREEKSNSKKNKNTLWFFGVGVSDYENNLQNLDFADRDALELEKAFKSQKGRLFEDVKTKVLVNSEATAREIKIQLYNFLSQAKPEDNIVIFIAGHGVQDSSQTLYYMPHDGDLRQPFTGMAMDDFKNFLDQRPINQKALFLLDICHAGAFDNTNRGRLSSEDVIKKLTSGTATTVFSSSTGAQQSLEDERFGGGHGAFTYTVIEALKGAADKTTGDGDGFVSLMEMIFYTKKEVARLTNKAQQPTVPVMNGFQDYIISTSNK